MFIFPFLFCKGSENAARRGEDVASMQGQAIVNYQHVTLLPFGFHTHTLNDLHRSENILFTEWRHIPVNYIPGGVLTLVGCRMQQTDSVEPSLFLCALFHNNTIKLYGSQTHAAILGPFNSFRATISRPLLCFFFLGGLKNILPAFLVL